MCVSVYGYTYMNMYFAFEKVESGIATVVSLTRTKCIYSISREQATKTGAGTTNSESLWCPVCTWPMLALYLFESYVWQEPCCGLNQPLNRRPHTSLGCIFCILLPMRVPTQTPDEKNMLGWFRSWPKVIRPTEFLFSGSNTSPIFNSSETRGCFKGLFLLSMTPQCRCLQMFDFASWALSVL